MDALAKATRALVEARKELLEHDMALEWDLRIGYVDSKWVKSIQEYSEPVCRRFDIFNAPSIPVSQLKKDSEHV